MRRAVILADGDLENPEELSAAIPDHELVVAADGGLRHAVTLGLKPDVVIGDMDSAPNELIQIAERQGAEIVGYPSRKDETDLELALDLAAARGAEEVVILGALGGRLDHALANVMLLAHDASRPALRLLGAGYELSLVRDSMDLRGRPGDIVTLLPLTPTVAGITTNGLEYALENGVLTMGTSRGVSNEMTAKLGRIEVADGLLLVVHLSRAAPD